MDSRQVEVPGVMPDTPEVRGDNGMPFPRGKATLYDLGVRVPLAISWKQQIPGGRKVDDYEMRIRYDRIRRPCHQTVCV